jgi:hypothetical protein
MDEVSRVSRSRRRSRRHSNHRSRSHSPRESSSGGNNSQENNLKQPQFIPIPIPYYQPPMHPQPSSSQPTTQALNASSNNNNNSNTNQPMSYVIQPPKQQFIEEIIQPTVRTDDFLMKNYLIYLGKSIEYVDIW